MKTKSLFALTVVLLMSGAVGAQRYQRFSSRGLMFRDPKTAWVDSVMRTLSLEQRIAQTMVVRVPLDMSNRQAEDFSATMNGYGVGGVCFFVGTADRQAQMTRIFQRDARVPLLVCIDGEWGLGMRLKDMYSFPRNAEFGKLHSSEDSIVYRMGEEIGRQCRMMGIHVNFAPVVDINSNPKNPVIGTRSFGIDRERVSRLGTMYALGQQSQGVMAVAKHFPGHGDTDADSHVELPVINHTLEYIDTIDTYPFRRLIEAGVSGVMVAHLQVNALDPSRPSSLSPVIVDSLLRKKLGFDGLVITDGIDMKGVTNSYGGGDAELAALMAGNDIILLPPDVPQSIARIKEAALADTAVLSAVDYHCRRVLQAKYKYVMPYVDDDIRVPGDDRMAASEDIVTDLRIATDTRIDSLVQCGIDAQAMPGCQLVVMHKGRVVLDRCYGHITYAPDAAAVDDTTIYDLASLTKVCATTLAVMKLVDDGKISVSDRLSKYLSYLKGTNKERITIKEVMSHQARLQPFSAYWQQTSDRDSILRLVAASPLNPDEGMVYSDLGFMLLGDLVLVVSGQPLDEYVYDNFYGPMGLVSTDFTPLESDNIYAVSNIAPTERDTLRGLISGTVHDPNAYAMGGVSGHAGLFSTAREVAALMQMVLDGGVYDGERYIKSKTVQTFTRRHYENRGNRRALGFDKQLFNPSSNGQTCPEATQASFGHTGFTGTMVWVDPEYDLVYVFLSNRVHPSSAINKLARMNIRTDIQSAIYSHLQKNGE